MKPVLEWLYTQQLLVFTKHVVQEGLLHCLKTLTAATVIAARCTALHVIAATSNGQLQSQW